MLDLRLYVKPGCHLCEDAEAEIAAIGAMYPHTLESIDISTDDDLTRRYWDQIPVLVIDQREYPAPLNRAVIERALNDAAARAGITCARPTASKPEASRPPDGPEHGAPPTSGMGASGRGDVAEEGVRPSRRYPWSNWLGR